MRTNSSRNGPSSIGPPSGSISRSSAAFRRPCSSSFDLTSPSVSRVAHTSGTRTSRRRYGSAPTWSSCAWVSTTARTLAAVAQVREVRKDEVDAEVLVAREREAGVDTSIPCSCSKTVMFLPTSPRPPSGMTRRRWHPDHRAGVGYPLGPSGRADTHKSP